jgi:hypothetical protein
VDAHLFIQRDEPLRGRLGELLHLFRSGGALRDGRADRRRWGARSGAEPMLLFEEVRGPLAERPAARNLGLCLVHIPESLGNFSSALPMCGTSSTGTRMRK